MSHASARSPTAVPSRAAMGTRRAGFHRGHVRGRWDDVRRVDPRAGGLGQGPVVAVEKTLFMGAA